MIYILMIIIFLFSFYLLMAGVLLNIGFDEYTTNGQRVFGALLIISVIAFWYWVSTNAYVTIIL